MTFFIDGSLRVPIATIKRDKLDILRIYKKNEKERLKLKEIMEHKNRIVAINAIKMLIKRWKIGPDEIFECERSDEYFIIKDEEPYGPDYSEEALSYSIEVHDVFGFDFKCKKCVVRATCCNFSNSNNSFRSVECDGVKQLLDAGIIRDIEDFYIDKERQNYSA